MKTKEELNALKEEVKTLNKKLRELTEDELKQVTGGTGVVFVNEDSGEEKEFRIYNSDDINHDFKPNFPGN